MLTISVEMFLFEVIKSHISSRQGVSLCLRVNAWKIAKHGSFAVAIRTSSVTVQLKLSF